MSICHACGAEQRLPMTLDEFLANLPVPKRNALGELVECPFCPTRLERRVGRPPMTCGKPRCRRFYVALKNTARRLPERGAS